jgi:hypothetical protein
MSENRLAGSFRDPAGFMFNQGEVLYRQVNNSYKDQYDYLLSCGLYNKLLESNLLVSHEEIEDPRLITPDSDRYKTLKPNLVPFVSYPYEWCFGQLKSAALLTLKIQSMALAHNMTLKDATAFNIQFIGSNPILIDTLSFDRHVEGSPWIAYQQFCQHFLGPLILMAYIDVGLNSLCLSYLNGIPLDLINKLLPFRAWLNVHHFSHLFLQAKLQRKFASPDQVETAPMSKKILNLNFIQSQAICEDLRETVEALKLKKQHSTWEDYYETNKYSEKATASKEKLVSTYIDKIAPKRIWDFGANNGLFSRLIASKADYVISIDADPLAVEQNFQDCRSREKQNILPLLIDLTSPSPAIGWSHQERYSLLERGPLDCSLALALIHHLVLSYDLPFAKVAEYFARCGNGLIIEFIPKSDQQVKRLLAAKATCSPQHEYDQLVFEKVFSQFFQIVQSEQVADSERRIYLMIKR